MTEWSDPRVLVAIYAAVIGTVSLGWNITNLIISKQRKLKVIYKHQMTFTQSKVGFSPFVAALSVEATNIGNIDLHIKNVSINFCGKNIKLMGTITEDIVFLDPSGKHNFPYYLSKGNVYKDMISARNIVDGVKNQLSPNTKLRFVIEDTLGKKYKSSKFKYHTLVDEIKKENDFNEENRQGFESNFYGYASSRIKEDK